MTDEHAMKVAKVIAKAMGDNFSDAFKNKQRWTAKRGMSGGRFRDVNEPFQDDYIAAAQAAIAALDAVRGDAEPVAWRYVRKPEEWPPANPIVQSTRWLPDDPARPFWIEQPLYAHPPRGDQVARFVAHMKTLQPDEDVAECPATWADFIQILEGIAEEGEPFNG